MKHPYQHDQEPDERPDLFWQANYQEVKEDAERTIGILLTILSRYETEENVKDAFTKLWVGGKTHYQGHVACDDNITPYAWGI